MPPESNVFTLGHSPDPDDAFMFYAMAENKVDLRGYRFEHRLEDIQTLNERALRGELHISAISIHAYAYVSDRYTLLPCGASMGDGYGPIVIEKRPTPTVFASKASNPEKLSGHAVQADSAKAAATARHSTPKVFASRAFNPEKLSGHAVQAAAREFLSDKTIAVPGKMTSAFLALQLFLGHTFKHVVVPFDQIFDAVLTGKADAGLIIHEGQLTYARAGFTKVIDLGEWWKRETGLPLPLGGNVLRKDIAGPVRRDLLAIMRESIDYGLAHRDEAVRHSMPYARDMDPALASKFIGMYVNDYTRDYGEKGRAAIRTFLDAAHKGGFISQPPEVEFAE